MMDRVLGPLPRHMLERADQHAEKYVRKGGLNWPQAITTVESVRAVLKLPRLQNLVMQHVDHSAGDFIDLLKRLLAYEPSGRLTAQEALGHVFFTRYRQ
ncbi:Serine/threonine-protein kinase AFC2 [Zea mays]|nr:Serine/threonine-protein kinase AFC2 [Zea mays]ONM20916.1 Serine/threonine-protein kinase AFC2 [Zea mays]